MKYKKEKICSPLQARRAQQFITCTKRIVRLSSKKALYHFFLSCIESSLEKATRVTKASLIDLSKKRNLISSMMGFTFQSHQKEKKKWMNNPLSFSYPKSFRNQKIDHFLHLKPINLPQCSLSILKATSSFILSNFIPGQL